MKEKTATHFWRIVWRFLAFAVCSRGASQWPKEALGVTPAPRGGGPPSPPDCPPVHPTAGLFASTAGAEAPSTTAVCLDAGRLVPV